MVVWPIEAIFSAADSGFNGSLKYSVLTNPAAYMGTITGCFLLPVNMSIPKAHKSFLLLWEPPHWYLKPSKASLVFIGEVLISSKCFREVTSSSASGTSTEGKQASKILSNRLSKAV
uniref:Uncharacterized protein n=1 Tax=Cricetulus griseus TaxID=10029 RepID=A0A8C2LQ53_CRIGR